MKKIALLFLVAALAGMSACQTQPKKCCTMKAGTCPKKECKKSM